MVSAICFTPSGDDKQKANDSIGEFQKDIWQRCVYSETWETQKETENVYLETQLPSRVLAVQDSSGCNFR